jgi:hypothetical protein
MKDSPSKTRRFMKLTAAVDVVANSYDCVDDCQYDEGTNTSELEETNDLRDSVSSYACETNSIIGVILLQYICLALALVLRSHDIPIYYDYEFL